MLIGEKIFNIRIDKGISRTKLSKLTGVSQTVLYNYESGKILNPSLQNIEKISKALGVTTDYLYSIKRY